MRCKFAIIMLRALHPSTVKDLFMQKVIQKLPVGIANAPFRRCTLMLLLVAVTMPSLAFTDEPEIRKEIREENGQRVEYMFINGVKVHETDPEKQPPPKVVTPKPYDPEAAKAPEDAIVLFDGTEASLKNWTSGGGKPVKWKLVHGAMESVRGAGYATTRDQFGSCKLHLEFATPSPPRGRGQGRGNSGVFLMGEYEIQVLDSYENATYPDGQCGALYGRAKPLVNACRKPGELQTFDITFHRPLFDEQGNVTRKARFHVLHNGHVIHDNLVLSGGTGWVSPHSVTEYRKHGDTGPLRLQDHGNPVRFRNIWLVPLED